MSLPFVIDRMTENGWVACAADADRDFATRAAKTIASLRDCETRVFDERTDELVASYLPGGLTPSEAGL
jgi:hypothetical protein